MSYPPPPPPHMHGQPQQPRPPMGYGPPRPGAPGMPPPPGAPPAAPGGYPQALQPPQQMQAPRPPSPVAPRPPGMPMGVGPPGGMGPPRPPGPPGPVGYGAPTPPAPPGPPQQPGAYRPPSAGGFPGAGAPPPPHMQPPAGGPVRPPSSPMAPPRGPPGPPGGFKAPSPVQGFPQQPPPPGGAPSPRPPAPYGAPPTPTPPGAPLQPQPPRPVMPGSPMPGMAGPGAPRPPPPGPPPPGPPGMRMGPPASPPPPPGGAPGQQPPPPGPGGMMPPRGMAPAPPRPAVPFYSMGGAQQPPQQPGPPQGPPGSLALTPPPPGAMGGMPPPPPGGPPGGAATPVQQLAGQFGQMGLQGPPSAPQQHRPPPMGSIAGGGGMAPQLPGQPGSQYDMQSPPVYPGAYPGVGGAAQSRMEGPPGMGGGPMTPGGMPGMPGMEAANQLPTLAEVDLSITCDPRFMRFSVGRIPNSQNNAAACKLPLGVLVQPMALDDKAPEVAGGVPVDVVNFGNTGIVRCRKCRTYINPFISWLDNGRRWRCNVCGALNDVPATYFHPLDPATGARRDKYERPELCKGSVEFVAPGEYMVRPPQPAVYVFVVDVSYAAVSAGVVARAAQTIKAALDALPGEPRTQFGLVTYDSTVHFYNFKPGLKQPQVLVVPDIAELFVPQPEDLLVNLKDSRAVIDQLLDALPAMYGNTRNVETALGPALTGAYRVMATVGGKMVVLSSAMPTLGDGRLKHREDPRALGTEREHQLLNPEETWYRTKAVEFSRVQISVDLFLFSPAGHYTDVASLATLPRFTAGGIYYYPHYADAKDGPRFATELTALLMRPTGFEAVMRVRATRGLKVTQFYGSYYIRGTDLLALPNCSSESVFGVEMAHDEAFLTASVISVQAALLHTTSSGERRIRVHTLAAPVTAIVQEVIASVDVDALCNLMAKRSLETALKSGLDAARHRLQQQCADILRACRGFGAAPMGMMGGPPGMHPQQQQAQQQPAALPPTLELLPLYCMALAKNVCFRGGQDVRPDARSYAMSLLGNMNVETSRVFVYPRLFALHGLPPEAGRTLAECPAPAPQPGVDDSQGAAAAVPTAGRDDVRLPPAVNLSMERFASDGVFLLENGVGLYLWVGSRVDPALLAALFGGVTSLEGQDPNALAQQFEAGAQAAAAQAGSVGARVHRIVAALREERPLRHLALTVVLEGDPSGAPFYWNLVEDRQHFPGGQHTYAEYMALMGRQQPGPPGAYGPPPGGMM